MRLAPLLWALVAAAFVPLGSASARTLPDRPGFAPLDPGRALSRPSDRDPWVTSHAAPEVGTGALPRTGSPDARPPAAARPGIEARVGDGATAAAARLAAFDLAGRALPGAAAAARDAARAPALAPYRSLFHVRPVPFAAPHPVPAALRPGRMGARELAVASLVGTLVLAGGAGFAALPALAAAGAARTRRRSSRGLSRRVAGLARRLRRALPRRSRRGRRMRYLRFRKARHPGVYLSRCPTPALARPHGAAAARGIPARRVRVPRIARRRRAAARAA